MSIQKQYTDEIREKLGYYANYFPNQKLNLGDYGTLDGNFFTVMGNIADKGLNFSPASDNDANDINYSTDKAVTADVTGAADFILPNGTSVAGSTVEVSFNKQAATMFKTSQIKSVHISNLGDFGQKFIDLCKSNDEFKNYKVITTLYTSSINTIGISNTNKGKVKMTVKGGFPVGGIDLCKIEGGVDITNNEAMTFAMSSNNDWQPLFRLSGIRNKTVWEKICDYITDNHKDTFKTLRSLNNALISTAPEDNHFPVIIESGDYHFVDELAFSKLENKTK